MQKTRWQRTVLGITLLGLVCVPTFVPLLHEILNYHHHDHCNATALNQHLHKHWFKCKLCEYLTSCTLFNKSAEIPVIDEVLYAELNVQVPTTYFQPPAGHDYLRGPPSMV